MDLTDFYATISGVGFTLLGLWWVVVDKHPEWFKDPLMAKMAYVVSLQFMIPAASSVLSLVPSSSGVVWRVVFAVTGLVGLAATALVARAVPGNKRRTATLTLLFGLPVYIAVVAVAAFPKALPAGLTGLQVEAFLMAFVLLLGLHAVWFFTYRSETSETSV